MAKTEAKEEESHTLPLTNKTRRNRSKFPPILTRTLKLRLVLPAAKIATRNKSKYQRTLIEEDELVILQGLIDFRLDKGKSMSEDEFGFYYFVKRSLNNEVNLTQLIEKVNSLKIKYMEKGIRFSKAHDKKCFELAKSIWGSSDDNDSFKACLFEKSFLVRDIARFGMSEELVKERWNMESVETKERIEKKLSDLETKQFLFKIEMMEQKALLVIEVASAMRETMNNS